MAAAAAERRLFVLKAAIAAQCVRLAGAGAGYWYVCVCVCVSTIN